MRPAGTPIRYRIAGRIAASPIVHEFVWNKTVPLPSAAPTRDPRFLYAQSPSNRISGRRLQESYSVIRLKNRSGIARMTNMTKRQTGRT